MMSGSIMTILFVLPVVLLSMLLPLALVVALQVWLCRKGKWLGLILPAITLAMSLMICLSVVGFSALTGGLPTADDLRENLANGQTVITRDEKGVSGVLHFAVSRASTEIRHLAVRTDCRGKGLAGELLAAYLAATDGAKSQVWARTGNAPAEHFYEQHGYRPDGWTSAVLQYN